MQTSLSQREAVAFTPPELSEVLHDRFAFERELGRGGMGLVYLARDLRHNRRVALKVLRPEIASVVGAERFKREIQLAAQLQHPHIVPVYESGEFRDSLFYVMPYIEGESLRDRLRREAQLPLDEALQVARELAEALSYAHGHGVVHRDIKPENILLANGHALIADFGIARAITAAGGDRLTETGLVVGTPAYMSPEQSTGDQSLDGRTDVYSLACVIYEMLAGEPPYTGPSSQAIIAKRITEPIPHLRTIRDEVPDRVEQAITKALAKTPAGRFASAAEFASALRLDSTPTVVAAQRPLRVRRRFPVAIATLGLGFAIGLGALFAWRRARDAGEPTLRRVAVLPFENLGDSADGYFADGVTDAVRGKLTGLPQFQVIASYSSNQYRHTTKPARQIGHELGVDYLLVGKVRWLKEPGRESRIQVSPELVDVASATAKWEQPFDAALTDVFQVQADIATQVAQALGVTLNSTARSALARRPTQNPAAYDSLLRGDQLLITEGRLENEAAKRAAAAYRAAVRLDSTFGLAWGRLAWAETWVYNGSQDEDDSAAAIAKEAVDRALVLAPDLAQTYISIALVRRFIYGDSKGTIAPLQHAQKLAPNDVDVLTQLAIQLGDNFGRWDEAVTLFSHAARLDPRSPLVARRYAFALFTAGRFRAADSIGSVALKIAPDNMALLATVAWARLNEGDVSGARLVMQDALPHVPARSLVTWWWGDFVWLMDDSLRALAARLPPEAFDDVRGVGLIKIAKIHWNEGRYDLARTSARLARPLLEQRLQQRPADTGRMRLLMTTYAYLGECAKARQLRERARAVDRIDSTDAEYVADRLDIALRCGDYAEAVAWVDTVIHRGRNGRLRADPGLGLTPAWFRIHPAYAPLRSRPDFERLVAGK